MKIVAAGLVLLCACVIPDVDDDVAGVEQALIKDCDVWGCGTNSPYIDNRGFHFLYADGTQNPDGFALDHFEKNGTWYTLEVTNGRIKARNGNVILAGGLLVDGELHVTYYGYQAYRLKIAEVHRTHSWATIDGRPFPVETYRFEWLTSINEWANVCSHPGIDDTLGMNELDTLVFEGDVIDAEKKLVSDAIDNNVINFGCAGSALAKQHLTGHTEVARRLGFATDWQQRQANLKLLTADYCGTGKAFTVGGQPLAWADDQGWVKVAVPAEREALWTEKGAQCLNKPRVLANPPPELPEELKDLESRIKEECEQTELPPSCAPDASAYDPDPGYHLVSSNPQ